MTQFTTILTNERTYILSVLLFISLLYYFSRMSVFSVSDDVKELIGKIISRNDWEPVTDVKYYPGTEVGDGYASKHVAVDITTKNQKFRLFVKYALNIASTPDMPIEALYVNETYFYDVVYPAYMKFLEERCIKDSFINAPKCYGTSTKNVIVLENLKEKRFMLFDRTQAMNEKHISLVLRTFAKFHAVSYAFKDQERERYDKLVENASEDFMRTRTKDKNSPTIRMIRNMLSDGLSKLDPEADKHLLEKCKVDVLLSSMMDVKECLNEYSILTQGDCWCNNMMFLYEDEKNENPIDVMLVDWQLLRPASPVYDVAYFFYTIANEEALSKLDFYLNVYYTELSQEIKRLGSDPDQLYPLPVFQKEWKLYCKYGFAMAFMLFKFMLAAKDEVPILENMDMEEMKKMEKINFFTKFDNEAEYTRRLRVLAEFMVKNDYL